MTNDYPIPKMPTLHTVDAERLRQVHKLIDTLAWRRQNTPLDEYMAETVDALVNEWGPIKAQIERETSEFHRRQMRRVGDFPRSVGGES